jgi:hypothetical protein
LATSTCQRPADRASRIGHSISHRTTPLSSPQRSPSGGRTSSSAWTPRYGEPEVNELLRRFHDDHATLRRTLVDEGFLDRSGGEYWRAGGRVVA